MPTFRGNYQHSIDHKGRVSIPSRFRRLLSGDANETFVLVRGLEACVALYPLDEWRSVEERLRARSFTDETSRRFLRLMLLDSADGALDSQGRVAVPARLIQHAELKREVQVNGVLDHIELWNPKHFDAYLKEGTRSYEEMAGELLL